MSGMTGPWFTFLRAAVGREAQVRSVLYAMGAGGSKWDTVSTRAVTRCHGSG
jgi:hypothetical protein